MTLRILNVAYPFAPAGPNAIGGAEQILAAIDNALVRAGHDSIVIACPGSECFGTFIPGPDLPPEINNESRARVHASYRRLIELVLQEFEIDVVHFHGVDFFNYLPSAVCPLLATLHLPPDWYPSEIYHDPRLRLNCVSHSQFSQTPPCAGMLPVIENGVAIPVSIPRVRANFALALGRICPEKGFHFALEAAAVAEISFYLGGAVFPYAAHQDYFRNEIVPRLGHRRKFLGPLNARQKSRFLGAARCLLLPSVVAETSSLVAMEALAHGTPVIAFASGAVPKLIEDGRTGFIVHSVREMTEAIKASHQISREVCRDRARERFSLDRMTGQYLDTYQQILARAKNDRDFEPPLQLA
jgi:glycosyltransferase involved in cell wall biosynthesis